jgi:biotin operon repressor
MQKLAEPAEPRPTDIANAGSRMLLALLYSIYDLRYREHHPHNIGKVIELMFVSFTISIGTRDNKPLTSSEIARKLRMPRTSVLRHIRALIAAGRVHQVGGRYLTDLDYLDSLITEEQFAFSRKVVGTCHEEWLRLAPLLEGKLKSGTRKAT